MKTLRQLLKEKYNLNNYQIAQLSFLFKTLSSEMSKMFIMGIIFHKHLPLYFFALFIMLILRCTTGGLHFYTYMGCLITSIVYMGISIWILPNVILPTNVKILFLLLCIITCNYVGPVPSKYRPLYSKKQVKTYKTIASIFIFLFTLILYITPESPYFTVGFWIIILHSLQLIIAKLRRKEAIKWFQHY